ncbi:hypothetical protein QBC35DRAFT_506160 [Podospora australis]|uniref:RNase III domain-containing protein n=1 Tax=Podospora australis TaxID=1536484 RepID=A0AAN6WM33_9PEZI|nr:hypothetical protein QBC35DRAFT_506160 [Podospora australis]
MALKPTRSAFSTACKALKQCARPSSSPSSAASRVAPGSIRQISTDTEPPATTPPTGSFASSSINVEPTVKSEHLPRWAHTPKRMLGPGFSINLVRDPTRKIWAVNEDPEKLDAMYLRLLGNKGDRMLPDEIKWLAVTHKSFDQGRRGYNTRLAYFGRNILALETTRSVLVSPLKSEIKVLDLHNRQPFHHPNLANCDKLIATQPQDLISKHKMTKLATNVGLMEVTRWKPKMVCSFSLFCRCLLLQ